MMKRKVGRPRRVGPPLKHRHCEVPGCSRKHYAGGLCRKHYHKILYVNKKMGRHFTLEDLKSMNCNIVPYI